MHDTPNEHRGDRWHPDSKAANEPRDTMPASAIPATPCSHHQLREVHANMSGPCSRHSTTDAPTQAVRKTCTAAGPAFHLPKDHKDDSANPYVDIWRYAVSDEHCSIGDAVETCSEELSDQLIADPHARHEDAQADNCSYLAGKHMLYDMADALHTFMANAKEHLLPASIGLDEWRMAYLEVEEDSSGSAKLL
ncbi:uncharacterized protein LOC144124203 [Amblyomma americanum]